MSPEELSPHAYEAFGKEGGEGLNPEALRAMGKGAEGDVLGDAEKLLADLKRPKPPKKPEIPKVIPAAPVRSDDITRAELEASRLKKRYMAIVLLAIFIGGGALFAGLRLIAAHHDIEKITAERDQARAERDQAKSEAAAAKGTKPTPEIERVFIRVLNKILNPTALRDLLTLIARYSNPDTRGEMPPDLQDAVRLLIDHLTRGQNGCQLDDGIEDRFSGPGTPGCTAFTAFLKLSPPLWRFFNSQPEALRRAQALLDQQGFDLNGEPNTTWDSNLHQNRELSAFELPRGHEKLIISFYAAKGLKIPPELQQHIDPDLVRQFQAEAEQR